MGTTTEPDITTPYHEDFTHMNIYHYLFYKIYVFTKRLGRYEIPFSTLLGFSFLELLNSMVILLLLSRTLKFRLSPVGVYVTAIFILIFITNYYLFIFKKKYIKIEKYFKNNDSHKHLGNIFVLLYVIISLILVAII